MEKTIKKDLFSKYYKLDQQIKKLEFEKKELAGKLLEEMNKFEVEKVTSDFGTFSLMKRRNYVFGQDALDKIQNFKDKIKKMETEEISSGRAKEVISTSIRFLNKK